MLRLTPQQLDQALKILRVGGVIVYPTETSYGIGCDATNDNAVRRLFELKGRSQAKGATVLISDISESLRYIEVSAKAQELMNTYWPGALNIIAPIKQGSPISTRCAQEGTQSVRVSSYPVASALVCALGRPLVSSSANLAGEGDVYCASDVEIEADAIIDAGELEYNRPSTIVRTVDDKIEILRQGEIKIRVVTR